MPNGDAPLVRSNDRARGRSVRAPCLLLAVLATGADLPRPLLRQSMRLVATTSDLASLARAVTGDLAQVDSIIPPATDPEAFEPRPSDLAKLKGAAIVVRVGLGYDHWLDKLLQRHGDAAVHRGGAGYVDASARHPAARGEGPQPRCDRPRRPRPRSRQPALLARPGQCRGHHGRNCRSR